MITHKEGKILDQWSTLIEQCEGHKGCPPEELNTPSPRGEETRRNA